MLKEIEEKLTDGLSGYTFQYQRMNKLQDAEKSFIINNIHPDLKIGCYIIYQKKIHNHECVLYCKNCKKNLTFKQIQKKKQFCCFKCGEKERIKKAEQTLLEKHGVKNAFLINREKQKEACRLKYGTDYYVQTEEFKEKYKQSCLEKYGVDNISKLGIAKYKNGTRWSKQLNYEFIDNFVNKFHDKEIDQKDFREFINKQNMQLSHIYKYLNRHNIILKKSESYLETKIREFLTQQNIAFNCNDRKIIKPKELDIYIPTLKLAIECNGDYWHSVERQNDNKQLEKTELCESKGIRLIHIWGNEIFTKWKLIRYILLCYINRKIPLWHGNNLPRDYFQTLDFPDYKIEEPILEKSGNFSVMKTGSLSRQLD